jgi:hypothetical protein
MVAMFRLDRHLHGRHVGRSGVLVLHRLQRVVHVRHSMVTAGLSEKLIGRDRLLMMKAAATLSPATYRGFMPSGSRSSRRMTT